MSHRIINWFLVFAWVGLIYATLHIMPTVLGFLREHDLLGVFVVGAFVVMVLGGVFVVSQRYRLKKFSTYALLVVMTLLYAGVYIWLQIPEERIHLVQYGVLALLAYRALGADVDGWKRYGGAFLLTSFFGWGDEFIQGILPNRYYETKDVILNVVSAALALMVVFIIKREEKK